MKRYYSNPLQRYASTEKLALSILFGYIYVLLTYLRTKFETSGKHPFL